MNLFKYFWFKNYFYIMVKLVLEKFCDEGSKCLIL